MGHSDQDPNFSLVGFISKDALGGNHPDGGGVGKGGEYPIPLGSSISHLRLVSVEFTPVRRTCSSRSKFGRQSAVELQVMSSMYFCDEGFSST